MSSDVIGVAIGVLYLLIAYDVPDTPEPRELVRQWLDESQRMLEATRRERAEVAEALGGVATRLLQLEQAAGAVAQGLRARR